MTEDLTKAEFIRKVCDFETDQSCSLAGDLPVIVDFWAEWCPPCKVLSPIMDQISTQYAGRIRIYKVNADEQPDIASAFNVLSMPSLLFIRPGQRPQLTVGAMPKAQIEKKIREVLMVQ